MDRAEATGLGVSLAAHGAVVAGILLAMRGASAVIPPAPAIEVSFAEDVGLVTAAPVPSTTPPAAASAPEIGAPEDAPAEPAPPLPEPRPSPPPPPRPSPRQAEPPRDPPRPTERRQQQQQQRRADPGERTRRRTTDGLNPDSFGTDPRSRSNDPPASVPGEARASIDAAIVRALLPCQRQPLPAPEAAAIRVRMRVTLNRDGSLARAEVVRVENGNPALEIYERRMQDLARNVINQCTPIRGLPSEYYEIRGGWRQFPFTFDPRAR